MRDSVVSVSSGGTSFYGWTVLAAAFVGLHLYHGTWSAVRSLGAARSSTQPLKQKIAAAGPNHFHRQTSPPEPLVRCAPVRKVERMVCDDDLDDFRVERTKALFRVFDLL